MTIAAEFLGLIEEYRQSAIAEWESLPGRGIPQPVGYSFNFTDFADWLEEKVVGE